MRVLLFLYPLVELALRKATNVTQSHNRVANRQSLPQLNLKLCAYTWLVIQKIIYKKEWRKKFMSKGYSAPAPKNTEGLG